ncbi:hypothetical protein CIB87_08995 [Priestia megaterium]|uniref:C1q domain-containing protein n=1 Tax=Priestia megaterium TaxID=1404 RepID=A0AA86I2A1_PRIMG|nr:hypothetical protein [Priestia megaterium]AXI29140.1 hypothetical protein CIB87_08995 [Priestia megaterium]
MSHLNKHSKTSFNKRENVANCQKLKIENNAIVKVVAGTLSTIPANSTVRLPFTTFLFNTTKVNIAPNGGITIEEDGEYFITFSAIFPNASTGLTFSIFSPDFSGTALTGAGAANYSELVCLRRGDIVYVNVTTGGNGFPGAGTGILAGILTIVKVED